MADASSTKHICAILWIHTICLQSSHNGASYILSLGPKEKRQSACPLTHSPMDNFTSWYSTTHPQHFLFVAGGASNPSHAVGTGSPTATITPQLLSIPLDHQVKAAVSHPLYWLWVGGKFKAATPWAKMAGVANFPPTLQFTTNCPAWKLRMLLFHFTTISHRDIPPPTHSTSFL